MGSYNFIEGSYVEYFLSNSKEDSSNSNVNDVSDQDKKPAAKRASNVNDVSDQDKKPAQASLQGYYKKFPKILEWMPSEQEMPWQLIKTCRHRSRGGRDSIHSLES
jgi:hypothetical protein